MANQDFPNGLHYVRRLGGGHSSPRKYTSGGAIYKGDAVYLATAGTVAVISATTGNTSMIGVAANYVSASAKDVWVYDDPEAIFEAQSDVATDPGSSTSLAYIGGLSNITGLSGNTTTYVSKMQLHSSGPATSGVKALKIVGIFEGVGIDDSLTHGRYEVMINRHMFRSVGNSVSGL